MTEGEPGRRGHRRRFVLALAVLALLLAVVFVPPFISVGRYKSRVARLISASLGRPVHLASAQLRLLPRPGFILNDLSVEEDPAFGSEPILHANTVTASIRLLSLWRGLQIDSISVDEASLNLVRNREGHWNVESLFRSASHPNGNVEGRSGSKQAALPYLEATDSRINVKNGTEKLPFSLIGADLSFWQEEPGEWRIRLRGQPARTDLSLELADTGIVRLEADLRRAPDLRQMPLHVEAEWREAQLGQLTRLLVGSDAGWRGNLTGELQLDGTPDAAHVKARLSASNVHRREFAPAEPMDFDANCSFLYHLSSRAFEGVQCDSPVGDGRIRLAGDLPGGGANPNFSLELEKFPVDFALNALRAVRSNFGEGLEASGTVAGKITYAGKEETIPLPAPGILRVGRTKRAREPKAASEARGPLSGSLTVQNLALNGAGLDRTIRVTRLVLEPSLAEPGQSAAGFPVVSATATIPAGATAPLTVTSRFALSGYQVSVRGTASIARLRELARIAGLQGNASLDAITGGPVTVEMSAEGPWLAPELPSTESDTTAAASDPAAGSDLLNGTLTFHNAMWKADYLANPVEISQATLHVDDAGARWDPIGFSYGTVKGTADVDLPYRCVSAQGCPPSFHVKFGTLDASALQAAVLGARKSDTLLSELIARLTPTSAPSWPKLEGTAQADSLVLGPVTLAHPTATLHIVQDGAEIAALDAGILGGTLQASGSVHAAGSNGNPGNTPAYSLTGEFQRLNPVSVGQLLGQRWTGSEISGTGKIDLSGYEAKDLASSATGILHFVWRHGSVAPTGRMDVLPADSGAEAIPQSLGRFDRWTADAEIAGGAITLQQNEVQRGARRASVAARLELSDPLQLEFGPRNEVQTARRQSPAPLQ
jgi:hypothetical protein